MSMERRRRRRIWMKAWLRHAGIDPGVVMEVRRDGNSSRVRVVDEVQPWTERWIEVPSLPPGCANAGFLDL